MTNLSVNLNKVALLRNQRDIGYPDLTEHARLILAAGAQGLTVHPRPDERHIKQADIPVISDLIQKWNTEHKTAVEFNIEGYPSEEFLTLVTTNACDQVTLVPDHPDQRTSDHGWNIEKQGDFLYDVIARLHDHERRVSVFIDPDPRDAQAAAKLQTDRVELYTGPYGYSWEAHSFGDILPDYVETALACKKYGLGVNAGHDLNLDNLPTFLEHIPACLEVSIGHAITDDALKMGWPAAVRAYLDITQRFIEKAA